jgi:hypothetical protein
MKLPVLGLLVGTRLPSILPSVLVKMRRWCVPRASENSEETISAWMATSPDVPGIERVLEESHNRVAVWIHSDEDFEAFPYLIAGQAIPLSQSETFVGQSETIVLNRLIDLQDLPYMTPFVRQRWRKRLGFPEVWLHVPAENNMPVHLNATALALASAAVVPADSLLLSLSLGTPSITDEAAASELGAEDGTHLMLATPEEAVDLAQAVAGDSRLAAKLSWSGRRLVEAKYDSTRILGGLAKKLGLVGEPVSPLERLADSLAGLGTSSASSITHRSARAIQSLMSRKTL